MTISEKISMLANQINTLSRISMRCPDTTISKDRWGNEIYEADLSNRDVYFATQGSCGCCDDAAVSIVFYETLDDIKIQHKTKYYVGDKNSYDGLYLSDKLKQLLISDGLGMYIEDVDEFLRENYPPILDDEDDDSYCGLIKR